MTNFQPQIRNYYFHHDALGNIVALSNDNAQVVETYRYDPYGKVTIFNPDGNTIPESQVTNPYFFTGREWDPETDLHDLRARVYSEKLGRFFQRDPIGYWGGVNLFGYTANDPINFSDPLGLFYFGKRRLPDMPETEGDVFDKLNIESKHEHGFFEDSKRPGDVGFRPKNKMIPCGGKGEIFHDEDPSQYVKSSDTYDDATMRKAMENVVMTNYCVVGSNCQDYADRLRQEYKKLKEQEE